MMADTIPSEFRSFVRETGIRAFDRLAGRAQNLDSPLRTLVRGWTKLSEKQKSALLDELIAAAQHAPEPAPASRREPAQRQPIKRFDPEEVAKTLPRKAKAKGKGKVAKAKARKPSGQNAGKQESRAR